MNHFANNGMEILKSKKTRNSKPKKKNVDLLKRFLKNMNMDWYQTNTLNIIKINYRWQH